MPSPAVHIRFVGMLSCERVEAIARSCIGALDAMPGEVRQWDVCVQPPLGLLPAGPYAVRAQARLADGGVVAIRTQGSELEDTLRDAVGGVRDLLLQEAAETGPQLPAWLPRAAGNAQALPGAAPTCRAC